jgi:hypothetical protein
MSVLLLSDLTIDYSKTVTEVYLDATLTVYRGGNAGALRHVSYSFLLSGTDTIPPRHQGGPSWVIDFSYRGVQWAKHVIQCDNSPSFSSNYATGRHPF